MQTATNYKGRVWTCNDHNAKIEAMISDGLVKEAKSLVDLLNPKKSRSICKECARLYWDTPAINR
jgi:hypothetical protein